MTDNMNVVPFTIQDSQVLKDQLFPSCILRWKRWNKFIRTWLKPISIKIHDFNYDFYELNDITSGTHI